jgi:pimeloyl-ACP methyl ester carboxylesterase
MADGVLFIHAFPLDASMWDGQLETLGARVPAVAVNLPGFGGTPLAGDVTTMDIAARHAVGELDRAGIDRAVVVGLSMGGYVAFELWRRHRDRVEGLVLANTRAEPDPDGGERRREMAARTLQEGTASTLIGMRALVSADAQQELWGRVTSIIMAQPPEAIAAAALGMAERPDSRPDLPDIDVPTLVLTSDADQLIPPELSTPMADAIPDAELVVIEGAGHLSNLERPKAFNEALERHLRRCGPG